MSDAMAMDGVNFEAALAGALMRRRAMAEAPAGLEQRLKARLAQENVSVQVFRFAESVKTKGSCAAMWAALLAHGAALAMVLTVVSVHPGLLGVRHKAMVQLNEPLPLRPELHMAGGGGGARDVAPATKGEMPKPAKSQIVPPKAPPMLQPKLAVEPTVEVQDMKMADAVMPNLGVPNAPAAGVSLGNGSGGGIGNGNGHGIGAGSGGDMGGGVYHVGGGVMAPVVLVRVDPEYSEEARKAHFTGNVLVGLVVDERGMPTHVRVVRGVGMGLDEKARDAVQQYHFKPATKDGKPVKVTMAVEVSFEIY